MCATAEHYTHEHGGFLAPQDPYSEIIAGHLNDISVALHSIAYELEQIRHALAKDSPAPVHTPLGEMSPDEWFGGSR